MSVIRITGVDGSVPGYEFTVDRDNVVIREEVGEDDCLFTGRMHIAIPRSSWPELLVAIRGASDRVDDVVDRVREAGLDE